jgi:hypothetical protein
MRLCVYGGGLFSVAASPLAILPETWQKVGHHPSRPGEDSVLNLMIRGMGNHQVPPDSTTAKRKPRRLCVYAAGRRLCVYGGLLRLIFRNRRLSFGPSPSGWGIRTLPRSLAYGPVPLPV